MPSRIDEIFAANVPNELAAFGEDIICMPTGGDPKTIKGIPERETRQGEYVGQESNDYNSMVLRISARNDTEGHVDVKEVEAGQVPTRFEIDGKIWITQRRLNGAAAGMHKLLLSDAGNDEGE